MITAVLQLEEQQGCEALGNLTATDTDGFPLEEVEGSEVEEVEETQRDEGEDGSEKQVICMLFVFVCGSTGKHTLHSR